MSASFIASHLRICRKNHKIFATQRGYGEWKAAGKREQSQTRLNYAEQEQARLEGKDWWEFPGGKMEARERGVAACELGCGEKEKTIMK